MKKTFLFVAICVLSLIGCTKQTQTDVPQRASSNSLWVQELKQKNPLKDSINHTNVYFRFDTILNDYEVSGVLYPSYSKEYGWEAHESGVRLFFHNIKMDKEYLWTNMNYKEEAYKPYFMSINVTNIICDKHFKEFKDGDAYIFHYDTTTYRNSDNSLLPYAEYQFYDADFDGEDELILGYYTGGPHGSQSFEIYEMTDSELVEKRVEGECNFWLDSSTKFDPENRTITNTFYDGAYAWGDYVYTVDEKGNIHRWYHASFVSDANHNIISSDTTYY